MRCHVRVILQVDDFDNSLFKAVLSQQELSQFASYFVEQKVRVMLPDCFHLAIRMISRWLFFLQSLPLVRV